MMVTYVMYESYPYLGENVYKYLNYIKCRFITLIIFKKLNEEMIHIMQIYRNLQQSHFTNDVIWCNYNMLDLEKIMALYIIKLTI